MEPTKNSIQINLRVSGDVASDLDALAEEARACRIDLARQILLEGIARHKRDLALQDGACCDEFRPGGFNVRHVEADMRGASHVGVDGVRPARTRGVLDELDMCAIAIKMRHQKLRSFRL